jgi:uncharacterized protein
VLARRYGLLVLIGLAHTVLLFPGDVLFIYGLTGLVLLLFLEGARPDARHLDRVAHRRDDHRRHSAARRPDAVRRRVVESRTIRSSSTRSRPRPPARPPTGRATTAASSCGTRSSRSSSRPTRSLALPWTLGLFLIGVIAHRRGYALDPAAHRDALVRIARRAIPIGLVLNLPFLFTGPLGASLGTGDDPSLLLVIGVGVATLLGAPVLAVGYMSALAVLVVDRGADRGLRRRLAALGRIALTGYLLQSILAVAVFLGLRLYGRTELLGEVLLGELVFVVGVWALLLLLAPWWTARFRYGPFEWLWRWGTYGVRPQMRA